MKSEHEHYINLFIYADRPYHTCSILVYQ